MPIANDFFLLAKNNSFFNNIIYYCYLINKKMSQLPADCLGEIFECLEKDKVTLHSCLLVNRLWCEVSVRILWKSVWNYDTLIACLPNESKKILRINRINVPTPTSKLPLFNYIEFIKILEIDNVIKN